MGVSPRLACTVSILLLFCAAVYGQETIHLLRTLQVDWSDTKIAARDSLLAASTGDSVLVFQVGPSGGLLRAGAIARENVSFLEFCSSALVIGTEGPDFDCAISVHALPTLTELSSLASDGLITDYAAASGDRLYVHYFATGLNIYTIAAEGQIVLLSQIDTPAIPYWGVASCNSGMLGIVDFVNHTILDVSNPLEPFPLTGYAVFDDVMEIGFSEEAVFVSGVSSQPFAQGVYMLRRNGNGFDVLSGVMAHMDYDFHTRTHDNHVVIQGRPYPLFVDRLTLYRISEDRILLQSYLMCNGTIDDYDISGSFLFVRDGELQQLLVYGIFGPPELNCSLKANGDLEIQWEPVSLAETYRLYGRASQESERVLLVETTETRYTVPRQSGMRLFDAVSVR